MQAWLKTVGYPKDCATIPTEVIKETLRSVNDATKRVFVSESNHVNSVLEKAGFIKSPEGGFSVSQFVNPDVVTLV